MGARMKREVRRGGIFTRRALLIGIGEMGLLGFLAARLYRVQIIDGARYASLAKSNRVSARLIPPARGRILDRDGVVLAGNKQNWRALLLTEEVPDPLATLAAFSKLVPLSDGEMARIHRDIRQHSRFVPILVRDDLTWDQMAQLEVHAPDLPGISIDLGTSRIYPYGQDFAHVVGYVTPPNAADLRANPTLALPGMRVGRAGVEKAQEAVLRGSPGEEQLEVNALGRVIRELGHQKGLPGADVTLTIDFALQQTAMRHLSTQSASAVVMDVRDGAVLAMASHPSFDPGLFNSGVSQTQWQEWMTDERHPLIDKAIAGLYPPGSTFKMAVALAALEAGTLTPTTRIFCPGYLDIGKSRFHCWDRYGHGWLDVVGGLKNSCDVFFYETARRTGIDRITAMAQRLQLGVPSQIGLPSALAGIMPTPAWRAAKGLHWTLGETVISGIGQGDIEVTPLQLATYVSRVATGRALLPRLLRPTSSTPDFSPPAPMMGLNPTYLNLVRKGMWEVVNAPGGTAPQGRLPTPGVQLAGKTGSSQVSDVSRAERQHGFNSANLPWKLRPQALFVCFAPYDAPRYAVSVVVEHGNAGGEVAAPIARDIMMAALARDVDPQAGVSGATPPAARIGRVAEAGPA